MSHREGQRLQDTVRPPCKELSTHPANSGHAASCGSFPQERRTEAPREDGLFLRARFQTTLAAPHWRLCRAHTGGLSGRVLSILSHFPPSYFPPSACHLKRLLSLVRLITPVLRDGLAKPKQQNVPKNKKLNPRPALLHTHASVNSSGHCLLASLPFSKDTIKGEIRAEGTSLGCSSAY